jgi:asparagine synthase (glutamine-hydrolysing)
MCGIAGIVSFVGKEPEPLSVQIMLDKIKHRGPDDEGIFSAGNICLGHVRLSILDLSPAGHQPLFSPDGRYCISFNGEIYNYLELRQELSPDYFFQSKTDTEVLLAAYIKWGEDCLSRLNGDFAFVIYDKAEHKLFGARDRFGIKPFYYYADNSHFVFASEIKAILPVIDPPEANDKIIFEYLVYSRTDQSEETFFKNILKLKHGHCFVIENNQLVIRQWYNLRDHLNYPSTMTPQEFRGDLRKAIQLRLRSDVPYGVSLSGGIDSSAITSILYHDLYQKALKTFTAIFEKGSSADESSFSNEFRSLVSEMNTISPDASSFFLEFEDFMVSQCEPIPGVSPYAQYKVMQLSKGKIVVTLDGQGADEMLGGYTYFYGSYFKELLTGFRLARLLKESIKYFRLQKSVSAFRYMLYYMLPVSLKNYANKIAFRDVAPVFYKNNHRSSTLSQDFYDPNTLHDYLIQHFEYKLEHLLKWDDLNAMSFSIESRIPFLDHTLVEKTLSLQSDQLIRNGVSKYILRESVKDILPQKIYNRRDKKAFSVPSGDWFRTPPFVAYIQEMIQSERFAQRGYFDVRHCKKIYAAHLAGKGDYSKQIWKWINLEFWFRKFIDKD